MAGQVRKRGLHQHLPDCPTSIGMEDEGRVWALCFDALDNLFRIGHAELGELGRAQVVRPGVKDLDHL